MIKNDCGIALQSRQNITEPNTSETRGAAALGRATDTIGYDRSTISKGTAP